MSLIDRYKKFDNEDAENLQNSEFKDCIFKALSQKISSIPVWCDYTKERRLELINNFIDNQLNTQFRDVMLSEEEKSAIAEEFLAQSKGFGSLDVLLAKSSVTGVIVNSSGAVYIETPSGVRKEGLTLTQKEIYSISERFASNSPVSSVRVDNYAVTVISQPVSDCALIIRKIVDAEDTLSDLAENSLIPKEIENFLIYILKKRKNIIISGNINSGKSYFLQILINSIDITRRSVIFSECSGMGKTADNIMKFNVSSLNNGEFENLLSASFKTSPDYLISDMNNSGYAGAFYDYITLDMKGIITTVRGINITSALSKFINYTMASQKSTEKQAKMRLSSQYDYIIHLEKSPDGISRIQSIMEITSTKSNSLVQNEIVKLDGNHYILDLPDFSSDDNLETSNKLSATFLGRMNSFP